MKHTGIHILIIFIFLLLIAGCKKDDSPSGGNVPLYYVTATVTNPAGQPQGGAILKLKGKDDTDPVFATITDSLGKGTIQTPEGAQTLVAKIGSVFLKEINVNVAASTTPTDAGTIQLTQNTTLKVLVVKASAEQLEDVLRDSVIGFTTFDSITVYALNDSVAADSNRALAMISQYTLIFSDCDGGSEYAYAPLARVYMKYVEAGGKIYGGHYNFYHLQKIFTPYYSMYDYQGNSSTDSISVTNANLQAALGFTVAKWYSYDSRALSGYEKFTDLPATTTVYAVIYGTSPAVAVIAENHLGTGKYLWTDYHNQDVIKAYPRDQRLVKIVQYFLYTL